MSEDKIDYLEVDDTIPGQNFVCLSFVSPDSLIQDKEGFKVAKFLQSYCKDKKLSFDKVYEEYKDFTYKFSDNLQKDFDEKNKFQTNVRGLKVRGVFESREAAESKAKKLQNIDSDFNVFVGQVGYWLPWDPNADKVEDEHFQNSQLNNKKKKYKENSINKDIFYEEQKREKVKAAREEVIRKKKEEAALLKQEASDEINVIEDKKLDEPIIEDKSCVDEPSVENEPSVEDEPEQITEVVGNVDEDTKKSLEETDPWMANKLKEDN